MSLRLRLLLFSSVILVGALVAADVATYASLRTFLYSQADDGLQQAHAAVEASVGGMGRIGPVGPGPSGVPDGGGTGFCPQFDGRDVHSGGLEPGTVIEIVSPAGAPLYRCALPLLGSSTTVYPVLPARITGFTRRADDRHEAVSYFTTASMNGGAPFRARASVLQSGPAAGDQLVVAVRLDATSGTLGRLRLLELGVTGAAVVAAVLLGLWSLRLSLRPLRQIEHTAQAIAAGDVGQRVPGDRARTEVGQVARALNVMLGRIEDTVSDLRASEARMRQFVADASHELRTPAAAVSAYAELFERGASEHPADLARVLRGIRLESARMGRLVDDLMLLARLDEGRQLEQRPVDLTLVAAQAVEASAAVGPEWPVHLVASEPVQVVGDELRLRQVVDNLLVNARTHCPPGTEVTITVAGVDDRAVVEVADDGPGLRPEDARRLFDRFYRGDPSRSRAHGGAGLGLAIVQSIVSAHGGRVDAASRPGGGAVFTITLPRSGGVEPGAAAEPSPHG